MLRVCGSLEVMFLPWDYTKYFDVTDLSKLPTNDIALIDKVAKITLNVGSEYVDFINLYNDNPELQVSGEIISYTNWGVRKVYL